MGQDLLGSDAFAGIVGEHLLEQVDGHGVLVGEVLDEPVPLLLGNVQVQLSRQSGAFFPVVLVKSAFR